MLGRGQRNEAKVRKTNAPNERASGPQPRHRVTLVGAIAPGPAPDATVLAYHGAFPRAREGVKNTRGATVVAGLCCWRRNSSWRERNCPPFRRQWCLRPDLCGRCRAFGWMDWRCPELHHDRKLSRSRLCRPDRPLPALSREGLLPRLSLHRRFCCTRPPGPRRLRLPTFVSSVRAIGPLNDLYPAPRRQAMGYPIRTVSGRAFVFLRQPVRG